MRTMLRMSLKLMLMSSVSLSSQRKAKKKIGSDLEKSRNIASPLTV